jgi:hypothetical protein
MKKRSCKLHDLSGMMAGSTGLEPAASGVTGRRYNRLNYDPVFHTDNPLKKQNRENICFPIPVMVGETGIEPVTSSL